MLKSLILLIIFTTVSLLLNAQISIVAGANRTGIAMPASKYENVDAKYSWQAGVAVQLPLSKKDFLYTGLMYETKKTHRDHYSCCVVAFDETITTNNITLPTGWGKKISLGKNVQLQLSAGVYVSMAVGGNINGIFTGGDIVFANSSYHYNRKVNYGSGEYDDLYRWNWGLEAGSAFIYKKFGLRFLYHLGISKLASSETYEYNAYRNGRYRSTGIDLSYRIFK